MPSVRARGPPANASVVPVATSAFQGGPGGVDEGSGSKVMLPRVNVIVPAEPVFRSPMTTPEAAVPNDATASHTTSAPTAGPLVALPRFDCAWIWTRAWIWPSPAGSWPVARTNGCVAVHVQALDAATPAPSRFGCCNLLRAEVTPVNVAQKVSGELIRSGRCPE